MEKKRMYYATGFDVKELIQKEDIVDYYITNLVYLDENPDGKYFIYSYDRIDGCKYMDAYLGEFDLTSKYKYLALSDNMNRLLDLFFSDPIHDKIKNIDNGVVITREEFLKSKTEEKAMLQQNVKVPAHIISNDGIISVFTNDGESLIFASDHAKMDEVKQALCDGNVEKLKELAKPEMRIQNYLKGDTSGKVELKDGMVFYDGEAQNTQLTQRILALADEGLPVTPMIRFLERLLKNTDKRAVDELWGFLSNKMLPLTEDGFFIAFRKVRNTFYDWYSNSIDNSVGQHPKMERRKVCSDKDLHCSYGYHCGDITYAKEFHAGEGQIIVVKVDPASVVSVPADEKCRKCRITDYEVLSVYEDTHVPDTYYEGKDYYNNVENDWDDEDNDENEWGGECEKCGELSEDCYCE